MCLSTLQSWVLIWSKEAGHNTQIGEKRILFKSCLELPVNFEKGLNKSLLSFCIKTKNIAKEQAGDSFASSQLLGL